MTQQRAGTLLLEHIIETETGNRSMKQKCIVEEKKTKNTWLPMFLYGLLAVVIHR